MAWCTPWMVTSFSLLILYTLFCRSFSVHIPMHRSVAADLYITNYVIHSDVNALVRMWESVRIEYSHRDRIFWICLYHCLCRSLSIWTFWYTNYVITEYEYLITGNIAFRKMSLHVIKLHEIKPFLRPLGLITCKPNLMHS